MFSSHFYFSIFSQTRSNGFHETMRINLIDVIRRIVFRVRFTQNRIEMYAIFHASGFPLLLINMLIFPLMNVFEICGICQVEIATSVQGNNSTSWQFVSSLINLSNFKINRKVTNPCAFCYPKIFLFWCSVVSLEWFRRFNSVVIGRIVRSFQLIANSHIIRLHASTRQLTLL